MNGRVVDKPIARERSDPKKNTRQRGGSHRIFDKWPWAHQLNQHYAEVEKETATWISNFDAFSSETRADIICGKFALCGCLAYPTVCKEHARAASDLIHMIFFIDEGFERFSPSEARLQKAAVLGAFHNPYTPRPKEEWVGGEMARQFFENNMVKGTDMSQRRFVRRMEEYLEGVIQQAIDREENRILDINNYIDERRRTVAAGPAFSVIELSFDIPDEVMAHPALQEMMIAASDMIACCNDMASYRLEKNRGDELHNIITCVMNELHMDVSDAMLWVEDHLLEIGEKFLTAMGSLPEWEEPLNSQVKAYCNGLGQWVRGTCDWTFGSERYYAPEDAKEVGITPAQEA